MTASSRRRGRKAPSQPLPEPVRLRTSGPADLLELVPYLLGFHPTESVVLVVIRGREVALAARVDLPPIAAVDQLVDRLSEIADRNGASAVVVFTFSEDPVAATELMLRLIEGLRPFGLVDAIHADGRRWWSMICADRCCPEDGTPYGSGSGRLAAEAVYAGLSTRSSRHEIEALVAGPDATEEAALRNVVERVADDLGPSSRVQRRSEMAELVNGFLAEPRSLGDAECSRFALLAADVEVRDVAWSLMSRDRAEDHVDLWQQVVSRTVSPLESAPLCLLGMAAWISGNGALMVCCLERVSTLDPAYTMAGLLEDINRRGVPPKAWDMLAESMREVVGPLAGDGQSIPSPTG
ncbi:MAG: hypothetical protein QOF52_2069 [Propionibacteriaceae bacterium]|jgi:hypothetical protein|nr:hypothetical protein [Propionibacteriaceae bacterium]